MKIGGLVAFGVAACLATGCGSQAVQAPPAEVRIRTADQGSGALLARVYNEYVAGVRASTQPTNSPPFNLMAVEEGSSDMSFVRSDLAYLARSRGTMLLDRPHGRLRGVALVGFSVLHVVVRADSPAQTLADLRGGRVGLVSASADAGQRMARAGDLGLGLYKPLLVASGQLALQDIRTVPLALGDLAGALAAGDLESALVLSAPPAESVKRVARDVDLRLIEIESEAAMRIRARYRFFKPTLIPAGTYRSQDQDVETIGVESVIVCHEDLADEVVYAFVKALFESSSDLVRASQIVGMFAPDLASATPIMLHPGAARYYREVQLPHY